MRDRQTRTEGEWEQEWRDRLMRDRQADERQTDRQTDRLMRDRQTDKDRGRMGTRVERQADERQTG